MLKQCDKSLRVRDKTIVQSAEFRRNILCVYNEDFLRIKHLSL